MTALLLLLTCHPPLKCLGYCWRMESDRLTGFTLMTNDSTVSMCSAQVRTINIHWRFGNEHQLGWIAIIFTPGAGIIGIVVLHRLSRAKRVTGIDGLSQATVFMLGVDSDTSEVPNEQLKDTPLKLQGGRIIVS